MMIVSWLGNLVIDRDLEENWELNEEWVLNASKIDRNEIRDRLDLLIKMIDSGASKEVLVAFVEDTYQFVGNV